MKKYSDWFKVDLHIHTDYSKKTKVNDYKGIFNIDVLKQKLIENEVKLFSLSDHNIINVEAYKNYYQNKIDSDPELLIGCELDIIVPESGTNKTYHSLIIFDNSSAADVQIIYDKIENLFTFKGINEFERTITIDELYDLFNGYDYFFIPHAGNTKSIIEPYSYDLKLCQQMVLLMPSAFEKVKEQARQIYNEGFDRVKTLDFQQKNDVPYINFSDNHNCNNYPCTNKDGENHEFYCIKGKPCFESIRFAFIDPESRIKKLSEVEHLKSFENFIKEIQIIGNTKIRDEIIEFSPNLNVIIGGRSSGKSLLFNIIGNKLSITKHDLNKYNIDVEGIKIKTSLDSDFKDLKLFNNNEIIYINQGDIVNYFENNTLIDLINESGKNEEYKRAKEYFSDKKIEFIDVIKNVIEKYGDLKECLLSNFTIHKKDIESILNASYFFKPIENIENKTLSFSDSDNTFNHLDIFTEKFSTNPNWRFKIVELEIIKEFRLLVKIKKGEFTMFRKIYESKSKFIGVVNDIITFQNTKLDSDGKEKGYANQRQISLKENINLITQKAIELEKICTTIETFNTNIFQDIKINEEVSVVLEIEAIENLKEIILEGIIDAKAQISLYQNILCLVNNKLKIKYLPDNSKDNFRKKINTQLKFILDYFDKPIEYLKYREGGNSKNNSPGFNSEKYLETILKNGNSKIILIDQPEDNLGNKFIIDKLINLIRDIKFHKQIILVTHNPSVVVYGDAENIILAENENNIIEYKQLVLEDKEYQKLICQVLDGGQYIFDQRARKYNIEKLIKSN